MTNLQDNTQYTIIERNIIIAKFLLKIDCIAFYNHLKNIKLSMDAVKIYEFDKEIDIPL